VELKIGDHQPRAFVANAEVLVHDLQPNATDKWHTGTVTRVLGPLDYKVLVDGHTCQAHIDHLLPCLCSLPTAAPPNQSVFSGER